MLQKQHSSILETLWNMLPVSDAEKLVHAFMTSRPEVGRVLKNCTQVKVKVLLEIFIQVKVIVWIVTWVRVKKYRIKKLLK